MHFQAHLRVKYATTTTKKYKSSNIQCFFIPVKRSNTLVPLIFAPPLPGPNCWRWWDAWSEKPLAPNCTKKHSETVLISSPYSSPPSKRSKPTLVITAGQKGGLLIISPLSVLHAQILDVSLCWGAALADLVPLITLTSQYVQTPRKCVLLNGFRSCKLATPLEESRQPHSEREASGGREGGRTFLSHTHATWPSALAAWITRMENNHNHNADKIL